MSLYFDHLPEELILIIIEYIDLFRQFKLIKSLSSFQIIYPKYCDVYMNNIYQGHKNNFKKYKLTERKNGLNQKYLILFDKLIKCIKSHTNELFDLSNNLPYGVFISTDERTMGKSRYVGFCKYTIYIILASNDIYYYIKYIYTIIDENKVNEDMDIRKYKNWKELHNNLIHDHIIKLYEKNGYPLPDDKFKSHKQNKF